MASAQPNQSGVTNATVNRKQSPRDPRVTSDSARRTRSRPAVSYAKQSSGRADHSTTSDTFTETQYQGGLPTTSTPKIDPDTGRRPSPVQNATITKSSGPLYQAPKATQTTNAKVESKTTKQPPTTSTGLRPQSQPKRRKKRGLKKIAATGYRLAARVSLLWTYAWTGALWNFVLLPLSILTVAFLGAIIGLDALTGSEIVSTIVEKALALFGLDWDFWLAMFVCYLVFIAVAYIQLFGIWMQCTLTGMKPLSGRGGGIKLATFLLVLSLYWVPFVNFLPLAWAWVFVISLYPR